MFRGNFAAKIDEKGRLKVPNVFRVSIQDQYGNELYITSITGESVRIYPMPVWTALEARLAALPSTHPSKMKFLDRVNFYGQPGELDKQGRIIIHARLRESASMAGEVDVFGQYNYLDVWNHDRFVAKLQREPFTEKDMQALADLGI